MAAHDDDASPVPRITFVELPQKWILNNPLAREPGDAASKKNLGRKATADPTTVAVFAGESGDTTKTGAGVDDDDGDDQEEERPKRLRDVDAWFSRLAIEVAPERHFVSVEDLFALYVADVEESESAAASTEASAGSPEERIATTATGGDDAAMTWTLQAFRSIAGQVLSQRFPGGLARRKGKLAVTCAKLPAVAENWPPKRTNKKERRLEKWGPPDPERSRNVAGNEGPTFMRYVNEMLRLACAPELIRLKLFPDAKELTESFAANNAIRTHLAAEYPTSDPRVTLIAVGDGITPRTAALCAFLTRWQCVSMDPEMVPWERWRRSRDVATGQPWSTCGDEAGEAVDHGWGGVRRLQAHRRKVQEMAIDCDRALLVMVHAHVSLSDTLASVSTSSGECAAVILPCCNWYAKLTHPDGATPPRAEYEDPGVVSPQRTVRVFPSLPCGVSARRVSAGGAGGGGGAAGGNVVCGPVR